MYYVRMVQLVIGTNLRGSKSCRSEDAGNPRRIFSESILSNIHLTQGTETRRKCFNKTDKMYETERYILNLYRKTMDAFRTSLKKNSTNVIVSVLLIIELL